MWSRSSLAHSMEMDNVSGSSALLAGRSKAFGACLHGERIQTNMAIKPPADSLLNEQEGSWKSGSRFAADPVSELKVDRSQDQDDIVSHRISAFATSTSATLDSEPGDVSTDEGSTETDHREKTVSDVGKSPQYYHRDGDPVSNSPRTAKRIASPVSPSVVKRKGKMDEWERQLLDQFVDEVKTGKLRLSRGNLARTLLEYINPMRDITFYEKLVSRRRLNAELNPYMGPRLVKSRSSNQASFEETDAARALTLLKEPVEFRAPSCLGKKRYLNQGPRGETHYPSGHAVAPQQNQAKVARNDHDTLITYAHGYSYTRQCDSYPPVYPGFNFAPQVDISLNHPNAHHFPR